MVTKVPLSFKRSYERNLQKNQLQLNKINWHLKVLKKIKISCSKINFSLLEKKILLKKVEISLLPFTWNFRHIAKEHSIFNSKCIGAKNFLFMSFLRRVFLCKKWFAIFVSGFLKRREIKFRNKVWTDAFHIVVQNVLTILQKYFKYFAVMTIFSLGSGRILCNGIWLRYFYLTSLEYCWQLKSF